MNLYEYARATEESGIRYYQGLATQAQKAGVKGVFNMLVGEERKLLAKIQLIRQRFPRMDSLKCHRLRKNTIVFVRLSKASNHSRVESDREAYLVAREAEEKVVRQYMEAAEVEQDPQTKEMLQWLAALERHELREIESLYDFVNAPTDYLEWAEFSNLDEFHNFGRYEDLRRGQLELPTDQKKHH